MRWWSWMVMTAAIVVAVVGWRLAVAPRFQPVDVSLDLSHRPAVEQLGPAWEVAPVPWWPGVFEVFDRGRPAPVAVTVPAAAPYELRLKLQFRAPQAKVRYALNGTPIGEWTPANVGVAEKRSHRIAPPVVRAGRNELVFLNEGPPRSVLYEQVRLRNYRSKIWEPHLYLVPPSGSSVPWQPTALVVGVALGLGLWWAGAAAWVVLGGWSWRQVLGWETGVWGMGAVALAALLIGPWAAGFPLAATPLGYGVLLAVLWGAGQLPLALAALLRRLAQAFIATGRLASASVPTVRASVWALVKFSWRLAASLAVFLVVGILGRALVRGGRLAWRGLCAAWRWFLTNQSPVGYLKMAAGLFVLSLPCHVIRWTRAAVTLGHLAGIAVVIACLLEAIRALKEEDPSPP